MRIRGERENNFPGFFGPHPALSQRERGLSLRTPGGRGNFFLPVGQFQFLRIAQEDVAQTGSQDQAGGVFLDVLRSSALHSQNSDSQHILRRDDFHIEAP